ncbi:MAG: nucleoside deaminase [Thermoleophilia bacterium]|jgi:tRNA(adenine34) deaminase|nr:nucleoside deaminase [Thermoleophilia bacterium]
MPPAPDDERWMRRALAEAARAPGHGDVPIGCVVVRAGELVGAACNERELRQDPTAHAECLAIRAAALSLGGWRLPGSTLYVTLEPCPMCAGAILQARVERVVYAAPDPKAGAAGGAVDLLHDARLAPRPRVEGGVLAGPAADLLRAFFAERREPGAGRGPDRHADRIP